MTEMLMKLKPWIVPNYAQAEMPPRPRPAGIPELPSFTSPNSRRKRSTASQLNGWPISTR